MTAVRSGSRQCQIYGGPPKCFNGFHILLDSACAIVHLRHRGAQFLAGVIFVASLVPPSILLIPFSTWLLMGYFKTIPFKRECALIRRREPGANPDQDCRPVGNARTESRCSSSVSSCVGTSPFTRLRLSSRLHARLVPVATVNEFVDRDIYRWGSLMVGCARRFAAAGCSLRLLRRTRRVGHGPNRPSGSHDV